MALSGSFSGSIHSNRYRLRVDWSASQSVANNTSKITATMYLERDYALSISGRSDNKTTIDGTDITFSSPAIEGSGSGTTKLGSVSRTVSHNTDGTKSLKISSTFYIRATLSGTYYSSITASATITLNTIPRKSTVSGGTGNIGSTSTINISRASSSFTHKLYYSFGSIGKTLIASNVGTSYTWTLPTSFYAQLPSANSGTGTIYCETFYNGSSIGTNTCSFTAKVTNSNPTFASSQITYLDSNSTIVGITGNNQHIVRNQSNLKITYTSATAKNSASISKYEVTFNGSTQTKTSATTIDYGKINATSNLSVSIKVTDSRGNTATATKTITILDWTLPTAQISLKRLNNYEDTTYLKVVGTISSVNSKNSIQSIKYRYKKSSDSSYSSQTSISNNQQYTLTFNKEYAWNMEIVIADKFGSTTYIVTLPKGMPVMFIDSKKLSVGINCFPSKSNSFEINGKDVFDMIYPVGSIYMSVNSTNPATLFGGTWSQLQNRFLLGAGSSYSNGATGGEATHTLTVAETPAHTHSRGTMNITGDFKTRAMNTGDDNPILTASGALSIERTTWSGSHDAFDKISATDKKTNLVKFNASNNWSGATSSVGSNGAHNNMPPYLVVYMWKRTA